MVIHKEENQVHKMPKLTPIAYLNNALTIIERSALNRNDVNWSDIKDQCCQIAKDAGTSRDTYPAINFALAQLKDNHSFLMSPRGSVVPNSFKTQRDCFMPPREKRGGETRILADTNCNIAYIVIPGTSAATNLSTYAEELRRKIGNLRQQNPVAWIVDLRDNTGGNMWPMLLAIGPFIGSGILGYFDYGGMAVPWYYERGEAGVIPPAGRHANQRVSDAVLDDLTLLPVAVLIGGRTASSGEAVAVSIRGRPRSRFFGQRTAGLATSNEVKKLKDGARLFLTTSVQSDRNHIAYPSGLDPDETIDQSDIPLGVSNDPAICKATLWIRAGGS